jgi:hypothetical protein
MKKFKKSLTILGISALMIMCVGNAATSQTYTIGQKYGGGVIFYVDSTGKHGLIAAPDDQKSEAAWGCDGTIVFGGEWKTYVGAGKKNTATIIDECHADDIAASICSNCAAGGYSDWFLPSKMELNLLYKQQKIVGNFVSKMYWSSSDSDEDMAWAQNFQTGVQSAEPKLFPINMRAVRAF